MSKMTLAAQPKLTQREIDLLNQLLHQETPVTFVQIGAEMSLSEHQIRYALSKINHFLSQHSLGWVILDRDRLTLPQPQETQKALAYFVSHTTPAQFRYSQTQMQRFILLKLLLSEQPLSTNYFMTALYRSRTTVVKTLTEVRAICAGLGLEMEHVKRSGYLVNGPKFKKLVVFLRLLMSTINIREIYSFYYRDNIYSKMGELVLFNVFELDQLLTALQKTMVYTKDTTGIDDTDFFLLTILNYKLAEMSGTSRLADQQEVLPLAELAEQIFANGRQGDLAMERTLTEQLNHHVEDALGLEEPFTAAFSNVLSHHLRRVLFREENELPPVVPPSEFMPGDQKHLRQIVAAGITKFDIPCFSSTDIDLVTAFYASELEKQKPQSWQPPRILVVCVEGPALAHILRNQLSRLMPSDQIDLAAVYEVTESKLQSYDLIISTVKLPSADQEKVLLLKPPFSTDLLPAVQQRLATMVRSCVITDDAQFTAVTAAVRATTLSLNEQKELERQLRGILTVG
ncbi:BglG family transcription antiterminator [Lapidilactobacillus salsurivasis]